MRLKDFWDGFIQSKWLNVFFQSLDSQFKHSYQFQLTTSRNRSYREDGFMLLVSSSPLLRFRLVVLVSWNLGLKGTQDWEFFWLRFWNLRYFFVSYVKILSFYKKKFLIGPLLGEVWFFRVVLGLRGMKKNFEVGQQKFFLLLQLWTLNMTLYKFFENSIN